MRYAIAPLPLTEMKLADDFEAYEAFVGALMKADDYYLAETLRKHISSGYVRAWWVKTPEGEIVGWCGLNTYNKKRADTWNFLGVAVREDYRRTPLALRLIRHVLAEGGEARDASVYIQPGVNTENLMRPLGFALAGRKGAWNMYVRKAREV